MSLSLKLMSAAKTGADTEMWFLQSDGLRLGQKGKLSRMLHIFLF